MTDLRGLKPWAKREEKLLAAVYALNVYGAVVEFGRMVGRTKAAVMAHAARLGCTRRDNCKHGRCDVCGVSTGRMPRLDIRGMTVTVVCNECKELLNHAAA